MLKIEQKVIRKISSEVYQRFPELDGSKPIIQLQSGVQAKAVVNDSTYVVMYQANTRSSKGVTIPRRVRVIADESGNILRMSTSH